MAQSALPVAQLRLCCSHAISWLLPRAFASAVVASVVTLTPFLWAPADLLAAAFSVHFEGQTDGAPADVKRQLQDLAVVKLSAERFYTDFGARSPLDRCTLAEHLTPLLTAPELKVAAIDFDLAPYLRTDKARPADACCQKKLNDLIDRTARDKTVILMRPSPVDPSLPQLQKEVQEWREAREKANVRFAHVELTQKLAALRTYEACQGGDRALGLELRRAFINDQVFAACSPDTVGPRHEVALRGMESLYRAGAAVDMPALEDIKSGRIKYPPMHAVLVGSGYTDDDRHATVLGRLDGVDLHAAVAACPRAGASHLSHFVLDVLLGIALGWGFGELWQRYFATVSGARRLRWHNRHQPQDALRALGQHLRWALTPVQPAAAWVWFVWMLAAGVLAVLAVGWLSLQFFGGPCATAIFPAGIVVGMLIEAAVVQSTETAGHQLAHAPSAHGTGNSHEGACSAGRPHTPGWGRRIHGYLFKRPWHQHVRTALGLLVILAALREVLH